MLGPHPRGFGAAAVRRMDVDAAVYDEYQPGLVPSELDVENSLRVQRAVGEHAHITVQPVAAPGDDLLGDDPRAGYARGASAWRTASKDAVGGIGSVG